MSETIKEYITNPADVCGHDKVEAGPLGAWHRVDAYRSKYSDDGYDAYKAWLCEHRLVYREREPLAFTSEPFSLGNLMIGYEEDLKKAGFEIGTRVIFEVREAPEETS